MEETDKIGVTTHGAVVLMRHIVDQYTRHANSLLKPLGITLGMAGLLAAVEEQPDKKASMKQIERIRRTSQPVTLGMVGRLEKRGLLRTYFDAEDARVKIATITEDGERVLSAARSALQKSSFEQKPGLSEKEIDELCRLLGKMQVSMDA